ncbi:MAG: quinone-dependent dihydroorotate dehydrogenase [Halodesulfurarchaeum sp.]
MSLYESLKPLLFSLPPETAHDMVVRLLQVGQRDPILGALTRRFAVDDERLYTQVFDCHFPNPVGVAAGFDKNARIPRSLAALGFGHAEVGGVTAEAQPGNPRPRLFRLPSDEALVNRMGFNNDGADVVGRRLAESQAPDVPLGVNIGKSKATPMDEAPADYRYTYERVADHADFFVVNVSSPNTPGLRDLQAREPLQRILDALLDAGADPLLLKLSPDLHREAIAEAVDLAEELDLAGIVATNTTTRRPEGLQHPNRDEEGGLSGRPIADRSTEVVRFVAGRTALPVVGVGGVFTAHDAYAKIRAGASLVQLYTGLIYRGPTIARDINRRLLGLLEADGFDSVEEAVGADLE